MDRSAAACGLVDRPPQRPLAALGAVYSDDDAGGSQQLAQLRAGGLLTSRRVGKEVYYRVDSARTQQVLDELQGYLRACCPPS